MFPAGLVLRKESEGREVVVKILAVVVSVVAIGGALAFALPEFLGQYSDPPQSVASQPSVAPAAAKPAKKSCCSSSGNCCCASKGKNCCCGSSDADSLVLRAAATVGAGQEPLGPALMLLTAETEKSKKSE
jgi:hypothetical protein